MCTPTSGLTERAARACAASPVQGFAWDAGRVIGLQCHLEATRESVAALEEKASYPHVTAALAELKGITLHFDEDRRNTRSPGGMNSDVIALSQRFAMLMAEYHTSMVDGDISVNEAKRMLKETLEIQKVLIDIKMHLEDETAR